MADEKQLPSLEEILARMDAMQSTIDEQNKTIVGLKGKVAAGLLESKEEAKPSIPEDLVEVYDKKYKWQVAEFVLPEYGRLKAEEAALDEDIIDAILQIPGQGILKEQV